MPTAFDVMLQALRDLDGLEESAATGAGTTTTIVDTGLALRGLVTGHFDEGRAFIVKTTDGLAPQGLSRRITTYVGSTITLTPALTATVDANDRYAASTLRYPANQIIGKLNAWLSSMGHVPTVDVSLTTLSATLDYAIPIAAKADLRQVWLATATAAPFEYQPVTSWRLDYALPSVAPNLVFPYQPAVGFKIRLVYMAPHAGVYADTDAVSEYLPLDWAALETAVLLETWRLSQKGDDQKATVQKINNLMRRAAEAKARARATWPAVHPVFPYSPA